MGIQPVLLWTDVLVWLLVAVLAGYAGVARRREHLRAPWRPVLRDPVALASATVLAAFVLVGLLDSLHYRPRLDAPPGAPASYGGQTRSVLDLTLGGLATRTEKTYSAPLATHLHARETIERADGSVARVHPRLRHGGAHLADPQADHRGDLAGRALSGALAGAGVWASLLLAVAMWRGRARALTREMRALVVPQTGDVPWHAVCWTLLVLAACAGALAALAPHYHVLGTDKVGQDVLYQSLKSIRTGLVIGTVTTLVMLPFAIALGVAAGYFGGWIDDVIQYLYTTLNSIPGVLLVAAGALLLQAWMDAHPQQFDDLTRRADARLLFLCLILGVTSWTGLCRLLRAETLKLRELDYVQAAVALCVRPVRILARHVVPNVMHVVLITVVLDFSGLVLAEAVLVVVVVLDAGGREVAVERLEVFVSGRRPAVQEEHLHAGVVSNPLGPDVELSLWRMDRDQTDAAGQQVGPSGVVQVARLLRGGRGGMTAGGGRQPHETCHGEEKSSQVSLLSGWRSPWRSRPPLKSRSA